MKVRLGQPERAALRAAREASDPDHRVGPGLSIGSGEAGGGQAPEQRTIAAQSAPARYSDPE
eukprot:12305031-Alexandrium_andersonii.AAC.1